jgi:glutamate 5-kinase
VLLVHDDLSNRQRCLNARSTLQSLLRLGVIPIINENDTVVTDEIRFGDNDTLAGLVANLIDAELLLILTDQNGLYDADPRERGDARLINEAAVGDKSLDLAASGSKGALGRGGMLTKVHAARLAARSGANTLIASGKEVEVIKRIAAGESLGTMLLSEQLPLAARKQWLAGSLKSQGCLILDEGAVNVLRSSGKSLLPVGVKSAQGDFTRGELVLCLDEAGQEVARGLINYGATETRKIIGCPSDRIIQVLGYKDEDELIHRDNLVLS